MTIRTEQDKHNEEAQIRQTAEADSPLQRALLKRLQKKQHTGDLLLSIDNKALPAKYQNDAKRDEERMNRILSALSFPENERFKVDGQITRDPSLNEDRLLRKLQRALGFKGSAVDGKFGARTRSRTYQRDPQNRVSSSGETGGLSSSEIEDAVKERVAKLINEREQRHAAEIDSLRTENTRLRAELETAKTNGELSSQPSSNTEPNASIPGREARSVFPLATGAHLLLAGRNSEGERSQIAGAQTREPSPIGLTRPVEMLREFALNPIEPGTESILANNGDMVSVFRSGPIKGALITESDEGRNSLYLGLQKRYSQRFRGIRSTVEMQGDAGGLITQQSDSSPTPELVGQARVGVRSSLGTPLGLTQRIGAEARLFPEMNREGIRSDGPEFSAQLSYSVGRDVGFNSKLGFETKAVGELQDGTIHLDRAAATVKNYTTIYRKPVESTDLMLESEVGPYLARASFNDRLQSGLGIGTNLSGRWKRLRLSFNNFYGSSLNSADQSSMVEGTVELTPSTTLWSRWFSRDGVGRSLFSTDPAEQHLRKDGSLDAGIKIKF